MMGRQGVPILYDRFIAAAINDQHVPGSFCTREKSFGAGSTVK
jgi:hypothetical protein